MSDNCDWTFNVSFWRNATNRKFGVMFIWWNGNHQRSWNPLKPLVVVHRNGPYGEAIELPVFSYRSSTSNTG